MSWLERIDERQARRLAHEVERRAGETGQVARDHLQQFARDTRHVAGHAAHQLADYSRHEASALAQVAARQALRTGRALKADPVPAIVGIIGIALLSNLVLGRRPHRATTRS